MKTAPAFLLCLLIQQTGKANGFSKDAHLCQFVAGVDKRLIHRVIRREDQSVGIFVDPL